MRKGRRGATVFIVIHQNFSRAKRAHENCPSNNNENFIKLLSFSNENLSGFKLFEGTDENRWERMKVSG